MHVVARDPATSGSSANGKKAYAHTSNVAEVLRKRFKAREPVAFSYKDLDGIVYRYDGAIIITTIIGESTPRGGMNSCNVNLMWKCNNLKINGANG